MGISAIKQKIQREADARIKEIERATAAEIKAIEEAAQKEREQYRERFVAQTEAQATLLEQKLLAQARLEAKKALLAEREALIDAAIERALQPGKAYEQFLKRTLKESLPLLKKPVVITCAKRDLALVKKLAPDTTVREGDLQGGVILTDKQGKRIDESLAALLERRRNDVRQCVAELLDAKKHGEKE